ncbi:hypothetical protein G4177_09005 [Corallococcus sp. ZKHCc1 1396]|uniref:Uncharacterized protein n=1 Tax=Corallococcus soli TaxID=2710757 RepID=A0ABR9PK81_9BACT|nr:PD40 domain-containing protein [Corallococcus soli]MBE4748310.1 hypothetical protein [Corallococcus soli]
MTKRVVWGALFGALTMLATGCGDECVDQFDCRDKGTPPEGQVYICNADNKCELRTLTPEPEVDAGTEEDAGTEVDAGTDAGTEVDAGTDAGTEVDAGTDAGMGMTVAKGGACTATTECMAGLFCEAATCQALHVAMTGADGGTRAIVARFDTPGMTSLSEDAVDSAYPRFGPGGTQVAFVQGAVTAAAGELAVRALPLAAGAPTVLTTGAAAGNARIRYMEWEPGNAIAWVRGSSGISTITTAQGAAPTQATANGTFPDFGPNGVDYAYSAAGAGISVSTNNAPPAPLAGSPTSAEQPHYNRVTSQLLFLANPDGKTVNFGAEATPILKLYSLPVTGGGTLQTLADATSEPVTGGTLESYIANPNWAPDGSWVAYVRAYYQLIGTAATLCGNVSATECGTTPGNVLFLQRVNTTTGAPEGAAVSFENEATLPSFSPDGQYLAYVKGGQLTVQKLDPVAGTKVDPAIVHPKDTYTVLTNEGDDHRPRWQPR